MALGVALLMALAVAAGILVDDMQQKAKRTVQASNVLQLSAFVHVGQEYVTILDYPIPVGAMPAVASLAGLSIEDVNQFRGQPLYTDEVLQEVLDAKSQMVMPIDFDQINWAALPEDGLSFPLMAMTRYQVGTLSIKPASQEGVEGYIVSCAMAEAAATDPSVAAFQFVEGVDQVRMVDSQDARIDGMGIFPLDSFIEKTKLTGKGVLYVSVPCMFVATEDLTGNPVTAEQKQQWLRQL